MKSQSAVLAVSNVWLKEVFGSVFKNGKATRNKGFVRMILFFKEWTTAIYKTWHNWDFISRLILFKYWQSDVITDDELAVRFSAHVSLPYISHVCCCSEFLFKFWMINADNVGKGLPFLFFLPSMSSQTWPIILLWFYKLKAK